MAERLATPRYVNDDDHEAAKEVKIKCSKGCGEWFVVRPDRDRKDRVDGSHVVGFYVCPCGVERCVRITPVDLYEERKARGEGDYVATMPTGGTDQDMKGDRR